MEEAAARMRDFFPMTASWLLPPWHGISGDGRWAGNRLWRPRQLAADTKPKYINTGETPLFSKGGNLYNFWLPPAPHAIKAGTISSWPKAIWT